MKPKVPKILILEDSEKARDFFRTHFRGVPVEITIVGTAAEAREFLKRDEFDVIALNGIVPSEPGRVPSLVTPFLAQEIREKGDRRPLVGISDDPQAQQLLKKAGCSHLCKKEKLHGLVQELLGLWPETPM